MKKLTTKLMLALAVLGFAGGMAFTPLVQTAAAEAPKIRVWVGQVNTVHERGVQNGKIIFDRWVNPQEVRCSNGYSLVQMSYDKHNLPGGGYFERWFYKVVTY